jgi:creatinase
MPRTVEWQNGDKVGGTFSAAEMDRRQGALRRQMTDAGVDACLLTSYHNICYYADFLYCQFGRKYALVVTHDEVTSVSAAIDGAQPWRRTVGNNLIYTDWQRDNYWHAVRALVPERGRIGIEFDQVSLDFKQQLSEALPQAELVDISVRAMQQRMIKSGEEIEHIAKMAAIADLGGAACVEAMGVGVAEHEVALHATQTMVRAIADTWPEAEIMDTWTWFQSGLNTDGAHNPVTSRKIQAGDILSLNCFPMVAGYYVALERTLFAEHASDEHLRLWNINCEVHDAGKALLQPGVRCCDVAKALNDIYASYGLLDRRSFGYGHSFGVLCHYYGREAGLELREDVQTVLQPGMVVSMEPMIMLPEGTLGAGGYREHDILVITDDGNRNVTGFPYGPEHNIISKTGG